MNETPNAAKLRSKMERQMNGFLASGQQDKADVFKVLLDRFADLEANRPAPGARRPAPGVDKMTLQRALDGQRRMLPAGDPT